ncbi:MAG: hypothetical protein U5R31_08000 [Acidimicrobiia bacterium]|nr:hypothetical protein [Acidimicrobiia bacterium]
MERRLVPLLAIVAFALALTSCGQADDSGELTTAEDPLAAIAASADDTLDQGTFRVEGRTEVEESTVDECTMPLPMDDEAWGAVVDLESGGMRIDDGSSMLPQGAIFAPGAVYVPRDAVSADARPTTPWLAIRTAGGASAPMAFPSFGLAGVAGPGPADPAALLDQLSATAATVEETGTDEVGGTPVTLYHVTHDRERYRERMRELLGNLEIIAPPDTSDTVDAEVTPTTGWPDGPTPEDVTAMMKDVLAMAPVPEVEVAVDAGGRVRRIDSWVPEGEQERSRQEMFDSMRQELPADAGPMPDPGAMDTMIPDQPVIHSIFELHDFGGPESVELPADEDVTSLQDAGIEPGQLAELDDGSGLDEARERVEPLPEECFPGPAPMDLGADGTMGLLGVPMEVSLLREHVECMAPPVDELGATPPPPGAPAPPDTTVPPDMTIPPGAPVSPLHLVVPRIDDEGRRCLGDAAAAALECLTPVATPDAAAINQETIEQAVSCAPPEYREDVRCVATANRQILALGNDFDAITTAPVPDACRDD